MSQQQRDMTEALRLIERAAEHGERAPSNDTLAGALNAASPSAGADCISRLERAGIITVRRFHNARQITIVATGKSTAEPTCKTPHHSAGKTRVRPKRLTRAPEEVPLAIFDAPKVRLRDPCPRCGVRADLGCAHGWSP
jgi:hypothetical protein